MLTAWAGAAAGVRCCKRLQLASLRFTGKEANKLLDHDPRLRWPVAFDSITGVPALTIEFPFYLSGLLLVEFRLSYHNSKTIFVIIIIYPYIMAV